MKLTLIMHIEITSYKYIIYESKTAGKTHVSLSQTRKNAMTLTKNVPRIDNEALNFEIGSYVEAVRFQMFVIYGAFKNLVIFTRCRSWTMCLYG